ncbi:MAG: hypothetical protein LBT74_12365 [Acidobacteriota bacterium]|jgi:hypothetical protein|nr:hypothetical protein [Acidobacteriota bacterium]
MYLDPGFGSMVVQGLVGLVAVASTSFYLFRQKIKNFFSKGQKKYPSGEGEAVTSPSEEAVDGE